MVLRLHEPTDLIGYILRDWRSKLPFSSRSEHGDIENFIRDLRYFSGNAEEDPSSFFSTVSNLGVGPIRDFASGSCHLAELDSVIQVLFV